MQLLNTLKLRKDLTKIFDADPQEQQKKLMTWATFHSDRVNQSYELRVRAVKAI